MPAGNGANGPIFCGPVRNSCDLDSEEDEDNFDTTQYSLADQIATFKSHVEQQVPEKLSISINGSAVRKVVSCYGCTVPTLTFRHPKKGHANSGPTMFGGAPDVTLDNPDLGTFKGRHAEKGELGPVKTFKISHIVPATPYKLSANPYHDPYDDY